MLSKNEQKQIRLLGQKKHRSKLGFFIAEGEKIVQELVQEDFELDTIFSSKEIDFAPYRLIDQETLNKVSHLKAASSILAIFKIPGIISTEQVSDSFSLALDSVSDPGNLGTIIRLCDWFGIKNIYCSPDTVDCYNPKAIQSTMGSIARVNCHYVDLKNLIEQSKVPVYGATLDGSSHYDLSFGKKGILVMGSESHGISAQLLEKINQRVTIPANLPGKHAESLNVATATAILLAEISRP